MGSGPTCATVVSRDRVVAEALVSGLRRRAVDARCCHPDEIHGGVEGVLILDPAVGQRGAVRDPRRLVSGRTTRVVVLAGDRDSLPGGLRVDAFVDEASSMDSLVDAVAGAEARSEIPSSPLREEPRPGRITLTDRERELLRELLAGQSSRQIAARWAVSENTVRTHLQRLYSKLGVRSRSEAAAWAHRSGLKAASLVERAGR